jgi:hypothetical protein
MEQPGGKPSPLDKLFQERSDIHEEAFVKTRARRATDYPDIHSASSALEAIGEVAENPEHLLDAAGSRATDNLPCLVEGTNGNVLRVYVQTDVKHMAPLENRRTSGLKPLLSRYPIDRGFLHSFTPQQVCRAPFLHTSDHRPAVASGLSTHMT